MYTQTLKMHDGYLAKDMPLPKDTTANGNGSPQDYSGTLGAAQVVVEAASEIALAEGKTLTVKLLHGGSMPEELGTVCTVYGGAPIGAGEVLGRFAVPTDAQPGVKALVQTSDPSASGSISIYGEYLAR
ncbi:hypothetical protein [Desulfobaculum sp.]